jgi:flavin-dependent dehydrogenase
VITKEVDLAITGAGPAGMAAAISAKKAGLENILLLERAVYISSNRHSVTPHHERLTLVWKGGHVYHF